MSESSACQRRGIYQERRGDAHKRLYARREVKRARLINNNLEYARALVGFSAVRDEKNPPARESHSSVLLFYIYLRPGFSMKTLNGWRARAALVIKYTVRYVIYYLPLQTITRTREHARKREREREREGCKRQAQASGQVARAAIYNNRILTGRNLSQRLASGCSREMQFGGVHLRAGRVVFLTWRDRR